RQTARRPPHGPRTQALRRPPGHLPRRLRHLGEGLRHPRHRRPSRPRRRLAALPAARDPESMSNSGNDRNTAGQDVTDQKPVTDASVTDPNTVTDRSVTPKPSVTP